MSDTVEKPNHTAAEKAVTARGGRARAWAIVYRDTHPDFRGEQPDGTQSIMGYAKYGGRLVTLATITDEELAERLADAKMSR